MSIGLNHYLLLGSVLFAISVLGIFLNRKNVIVLLMAIIGALVLAQRGRN